MALEGKQTISYDAMRLSKGGAGPGRERVLPGGERREQRPELVKESDLHVYSLLLTQKVG